MKREWFPHDYDARSDSKLVLLLHTCGRQAIGLYWMMVEAMHRSGGTLSAVDVQALTLTEPSEVNDTTIARMVELGLIVANSDGSLTSERVMANLRDRDAATQKRAMAGSKGGKVSAQSRTDDEAMLKQCSSNAQAMLKQTEANSSTLHNITLQDNTEEDSSLSLTRTREGPAFDPDKAAEAIAKRYPTTWEEAMPYFELYGGTEDDCKDWFDFRSGDGWKKGTNESRRYIADWHSDARAWARKRVKERAEGKLNKETKNATHQPVRGERQVLNSEQRRDYFERIDKAAEQATMVYNAVKEAQRGEKHQLGRGTGGDTPSDPA